MCLLHSAESWDRGRIRCTARSHLALDNPLRRDGRLSTVCGCEYGFQAAALHGALTAGGIAQPPAFLAALRISLMARDALDDPALGVLQVDAVLEAGDASGMIYTITLSSESGETILQARATIAMAIGAHA